ncbi:MAG TPA: nuclear transport factor 2 family protein [Acidobacteriaceae bacterium]|jgi:hypothetical protein|nr:nuclear transport factor 2 family protein [Acidobacteriaceae bacterium]
MNISRLGWFFVAMAAIAAVAAGVGLFTLRGNPAKPDEHAVLVPVNALFDGLDKRDAAEIEASAIPGATFVSMQYGTLEQITFEQFAQRVGVGTTHIDERIHDPLVRVDNDLAVVWAPFEFRIDGKLDHCGTDLFSLVHNNGTWLIGSLSATLRKDCGTQ